MLLDFLKFLKLDNNINNKKSITNTNNSNMDEQTEEFIIEMQSPHFQEEIATEVIVKDNKTIEIKKIKSVEPLNNGKTLISVKTYKKDITRV